MRAVAALALCLAAACSAAEQPERVHAAIQEAAVGAPSQLRLNVASCNADPSAEVEETADEVVVTVSADDPGPEADACSDGVVVDLEQPLGDRELLDGSTGEIRTVVDAQAPQPLDAEQTTAFCAAWAPMRGEQPESYVGSDEHLDDLNRLVRSAPRDEQHELARFRDFVAAEVDPAVPGSQIIGSWPEPVQALVGRVRTFVDETCPTVSGS